ncbi:MAG: dihydroorotase family protein, partial [Candidatus Omnitrophica bacterium]|nr:dihydroorotase family protein [Candidatus Omnitrophota bacterium]
MDLENKIINEKDAFKLLRGIGAVDIHVHPRDMDQHQRFTIAEYRRLAKLYGVKFSGFMPNTDPAITNEETLLRYVEIAKKSDHTGVKFMIWFGLTSNPEQIKEAVRLYGKYKEYIIGLKMYAGTSTGNLGLVEEEQQRAVYRVLSELNYEGVLAVHCEEDKLMYPEKYNPQKPESWAEARPEESEISSVNQNIRLAKEYRFPGWLHICHVSSHISVIEINEARKQRMRISCGATIQHLIFDTEEMAGMSREGAVGLKCNPPVRGRDNRRWLLEDLKLGLIDVFESDFAPHTKEDKEKNDASGVSNY